ncbi:MAG: cupin domain-containing protein [Actinomycetes bacterium]
MRTPIVTTTATLALLGLVFYGSVGALPAGAATPTAPSTTTAAAATSTPTLLPVDDVSSKGGITRKVLGAASPSNGPGQSLYLTRVRIAPGVPLPEHFHAGTQVFRVMSGTLTYTIVEGSAVVTRSGGASRTYFAPTTLELQPGDALVEPPGMVHRGKNATRRPVVTVTAALLANTAGLSTPVGAAVAGTAVAGTFPLALDAKTTNTVGPAGSRSYGTVVEQGDTTIGGEAVRLDLTAQINYTDGSGPWTGLMTLTWPDGTTLGGTIQGATVATNDGGASFVGTIGVIGGTGRFAGATGGSGTYVGSRPGALGSPITATIDLTLADGRS